MDRVGIALVSREQDLSIFDEIIHSTNSTRPLVYNSLAEFEANPSLIVILFQPQNIPDYAEYLPNLRPRFPVVGFILVTKDYDEDLAVAFIKSCSGQYLTTDQLGILQISLEKLVEFKLYNEMRRETITQQQDALVRLSNTAAMRNGDWYAAIREICAVTSQTLDVSRVSIWLYDAFGSKIICECLYQLDSDTITSGKQLEALDFPAYFAALKDNRVIAATEAYRDAATFEFVEPYFKPNNIFSLLDAPIRVAGETIGVVCFEQQQATRIWRYDDQFFAGAVADLAALAYEVREHKRAEDTMRRSEKLKSLGLLASGIAHDFNNLLTVILSQASLMADQLDKEQNAHKALHRIVSTTRQAAALTRQLLIYAGDKPVSITAVNLADFFAEQADFLRLAIPPNIDLKLPNANALAIYADSVQLQQVLMNLVINAAEAMGTQYGTIIISAEAQSLTETFTKAHSFVSEGFTAGDYICLTIKDTGLGMDDEMLSHIFEPFFSTKSDGRGLGLATVLGIVRSHHGVLCVNSILGEGTSFCLYFKQAEYLSKERREATQPMPISQRTVLVVDDAPEIVESLSEILEINGLNARVAYTGNEAIDIYRTDADSIDLILVDMAMPGMNGVETFAQLRLIRADAKVILLSGYNDKDIAKQFDGEHPNAVLTKPYDVDTLLETLWLHLS